MPPVNMIIAVNCICDAGCAAWREYREPTTQHMVENSRIPRWIRRTGLPSIFPGPINILMLIRPINKPDQTRHPGRPAPCQSQFMSTIQAGVIAMNKAVSPEGIHCATQATDPMPINIIKAPMIDAVPQ